MTIHTATASAATDVHAVGAAGPLVLVDGAPRTDLTVVELTLDGPLDRRRATLRATSRDRTPIGAAVTILQPVALTGGVTRLLPLLDGRIVRQRRDLSGEAASRALEAECHWSRTLAQPLSADTLGSDVGTFDAAAHAIDAAAGLGLMLPSDPTPLGDLPQGGTVGAVLARLLDGRGAVVRRELRWRSGRVEEARRIQPAGAARPVRLPMPALANPAGAVAALRDVRVGVGPIKLIARAAGPVVESTFLLQPGWDATRQDHPDAEYARATSGDFDAVVHVFRRWVLNEDGAFAGEPFDLAGLFETDAPIEPWPLRFGDCLTLDAQGQRRRVILETSTDGGASWRHHPGPWSRLDDRAGVYLEDEPLAAAWLAAVRQGTARVRVTATLRRPEPLTAIRWVGNPFRGPHAERRIALGERFVWRWVDAGSRFASAIAAGEREAATVDERPAMRRWLAEHARSLAASAAREIRVETVRPIVGPRPGDRLAGFGGAVECGLTPIGRRTDRPTPRLRRIVHRFERPGGTLHFETTEARS